MSQLGKVALVTGGALGIGRVFTESLLAEGASVAVCDVHKNAEEAKIQEISNSYGNKVLFQQCDVTNPEQLEACFKRTREQLSRLDIVVNNAVFANEKEDGWRKMIEVNLVGVIRGTKLALKYMGKDRGFEGGTVVNVASITCLVPFPSLPVYSATKAAVNQFSRSYGSDLYYQKCGVKVLAINPGRTNAWNHLMDVAAENEETFVHMKHQVESYRVQDTKNMGRGLIEVLKNGKNGSLWTIEDDEPPKLM